MAMPSLDRFIELLEREGDRVDLRAPDREISYVRHERLAICRVDLAPSAGAIQQRLGLDFSGGPRVLGQKLLDHRVESDRVLPQTIGVDQQSDHDEEIALLAIAGLV